MIPLAYFLKASCVYIVEPFHASNVRTGKEGLQETTASDKWNLVYSGNSATTNVKMKRRTHKEFKICCAWYRFSVSVSIYVVIFFLFHPAVLLCLNRELPTAARTSHCDTSLCGIRCPAIIKNWNIEK